MRLIVYFCRMLRIGRSINRALGLAGLELRRASRPRTEPFDDIFEQVKPFTLTSRERVPVLCETVAHVVRVGIPGDFVECGVWRGGSSMAAALAFMRCGDTRRDLHLFDTFEGMPPASPDDKDAETGEQALHEWNGVPIARAAQEEVRTNTASTGYDMARIHFHRGMVEETIPAQAPQQIAILRLDTDWYESTRHELDWLWPRVTPGGFLIVDDYGHFTGAKKAVDDFFGGKAFLFRIDYTGRLVMKPSAA